MRFLTGDEVGFIKDVRTIKEAKKAQTPVGFIKEKTQTPETPDEKSLEEFDIKTWSALNRANAVNCLAWAQNLSHVISASIDGNARYYSSTSGSLLKTLKCFTNIIDPDTNLNKLNKFRKPEHFVGLHEAYGNTLIHCTDIGNVSYQRINLNDNEADENPEFELPLYSGNINQDNLFCMKVHTAEPNLFITGGHERDLTLWDVNSIQEDTTPKWKAKNVRHDFLDMRQPVWVKALQFLDPKGDPSKIIVGTGYGQIRLYDFKNGNGLKNKRDENRPLFDFKTGEIPINAFEVSPDQQTIVFSDTQGSISQFDIRNQKIVGVYKGTSGAITDIKMVEKKPLVAAVGLDRYLRVWERDGTRKQIQKIYIKQKMSSLLIDESFFETKVTKKPAETDLWKGMEVIS